VLNIVLKSIKKEIEMSKNRFNVFISDAALGAGWHTVSASDHQAAVEAVSNRVERYELEWGSVQNDDGTNKTFIAPKPR
jgi:hypothetical protein